MPITITLGRMTTYHDEFLARKLYDPVITWSYKINWQIKTIISTIPQCPWPPNMVGFNLP